MENDRRISCNGQPAHSHNNALPQSNSNHYFYASTDLDTPAI